MGTFKVSNLNVITEKYNGDDIKEYFIQAHCEVVDRSDPRGGEAFTVNIVSPLYLARRLSDSVELGRSLILLNYFDKEKVISKIQALIDQRNATSWDELSSYIEKYFDWI